MNDDELKNKVKAAVEQIAIDNWDENIMRSDADDYEYQYCTVTEKGVNIKIIYEYSYVEGKYTRSKLRYTLFADEIEIIFYQHVEEDSDSYDETKIFKKGDKWLETFTSKIQNGILESKKNKIISQKNDLLSKLT